MSEPSTNPALDIVARVYQSAASAGLLKRCVWPVNAAMPLTHMVGLRAPDDSVLDNLTRSKETTISYPATIFIGLKIGDEVAIEGQRFQVREIKAVGDGAEKRARLTRI